VKNLSAVDVATQLITMVALHIQEDVTNASVMKV
jgi:hypothetical protein